MAETAKPSNGEVIEITDSLDRKIKLKTLGPADMLNLLEAAGTNSGNAAWVRMAMIVASVREIDGVPVPVANTKDKVLRGATVLGNEGLVAATRALFGVDEAAPEAETEDGEAPAEAKPSEELVAAKN